MRKQLSSRGLHRLLPLAGVLPGMIYAIAVSGATLKASLNHPVLPVAATAANETPAAKIDFARDIEPIFKANCVKCHGGETMMGGLRLDVKSYAMQGGDSGPAIVPGSSEKSLLVQRILGLGGKPQMPKGVAPLSADDISKIRAWIDGGAAWEGEAAPPKHWAFLPPRRPVVPAVHRSAWPQNPIDNFILARLEKEGMTPSPPADRPTLIRRVFLDLTGIPPLPTEVDVFVNDKSPDAYAKVVDRLLSSPRYGERMAMDWLDGARYADSNGYQADYERYQWRWRDWVINAFNQNKPFDQFTIEQIAGDLLPNATLDQKIATGFNRNHRINTEGGVIPEEWRVETVIDRVETTSQVWLGLTMGCARCHNHKYDPITQKDFYSFYHYFNNVSESGTGEEKAINHPPFIKAPSLEQTTRLAALDTQMHGADSWLADRVVANLPRSAGWKLGSGANADGSLLDGLVARYALSAHPRVAAGTAPVPTLSGPVTGDAGHTSGAVFTSNGAFVDLGNVGDFDTKDSFSYGAWINPTTGDGSPLSRMDKAADYRGWDILLAGGRPAVHLINKWPTNALKIIGKTPIPNGQWTHILLTYDGSAKPAGIKLYINGKPTDFDVEVNALSDTIRTAVSAKIGTRTGSDPFSGKVDDVVLYKRVVTPDEALRLVNADPAGALLAIPEDKRTEDQKREVARLWSDREDPEYKQHATARAALAAVRDGLDGQISTVMIMDEMPQPRDCFVLTRGQYDKHGEKVPAAIPAVFGGLPPGAPNNRLGLAEWIASPNNPLTARVAVNRLWEKFFGAGIVRTSEDFGTRAEPPTNPELLDWLATEFVRLHWDLKAIQREMVMSATYRQSSRVTPEGLQKDPENRLLARGPRFRLQAEVIRDEALAATGLLSESVGGPSVRPYQPDGIWDETSSYGNLHNYMHDKGPNLYRRSLYTIWKRTAAPPEMTLFDAPTREVSCVRRARTNTPLQALVLLNDETFVEASRVLGQQMIRNGGTTPADRISYAFQRILCRRPTQRELAVLVAGNEKRLAKYHADPDAAKHLLDIGDAPLDPKQDASEQAAYSLTASVIMNMDEAITKN